MTEDRLKKMIERFEKVDISLRNKRGNLAIKQLKLLSATFLSKLQRNKILQELGLTFLKPKLTSKSSATLPSTTTIFHEYDIIFPIQLDDTSWTYRRVYGFEGFKPYAWQMRSCGRRRNQGVINEVVVCAFAPDLAKRILGVLQPVAFQLQLSIIDLDVKIDIDLTFIDPANTTTFEEVSIPCVPLMTIESPDAPGGHMTLIKRLVHGENWSYWMQPFGRLEAQILEERDVQDGGCRMKMVTILRRLSANNQNPLSGLDRTVRENLVLNLCDAGGWEMKNFSKMLEFVLNSLECCLLMNKLPRHLEPEHNLLAKMPRTKCLEMAKYLSTIRLTGSHNRVVEECLAVARSHGLEFESFFGLDRLVMMS